MPSEMFDEIPSPEKLMELQQRSRAIIEGWLDQHPTGRAFLFLAMDDEGAFRMTACGEATDLLTLIDKGELRIEQSRKR